MKLLSFLINSNFYIALAAVLLTVETQIQLGMKPEWHPYMSLIFFATLFEYNLHRLVTIVMVPESLKSEKHNWVNNNRRLFYFIVLASVTGFIVSLIEAKLSVLIALSPLALITVFYSTPLSRIGKRIFRMREIPFLKIFLISIVWSVLTVLLPVIYSETGFDKTHILLMMTERFLFVFAITIPFDIRDMIVDKTAGLKTIPLKIGKRNSELISVWLLILFILISVIHYVAAKQYLFAFILPASGLITIFCLESKKIQTLPFYHYGILDGMMILQAVMIIIVNVLIA